MTPRAVKYFSINEDHFFIDWLNCFPLRNNFFSFFLSNLHRCVSIIKRSSVLFIVMGYSGTYTSHTRIFLTNNHILVSSSMSHWFFLFFRARLSIYTCTHIIFSLLYVRSTISFCSLFLFYLILFVSLNKRTHVYGILSKRLKDVSFLRSLADILPPRTSIENLEAMNRSKSFLHNRNEKWKRNLIINVH
jgi:hypothetical protein